MHNLHNKRKLLLALIDYLCLVVASVASEFFVCTFRKFDFSLWHMLLCLGIFTVVVFGARLILKVYSNIWRYANCRAYLAMVMADIFAGALAAGIFLALDINGSSLYNFWQPFAVLTTFDIITLSTRFVYQTSVGKWNRIGNVNQIEVAIIGAGKTGVLFAEELLTNPDGHYRPICFVDLDKEKIGNTIFGLKVYGESEFVQKVRTLPIQELFVALPNMSVEKAAKLHTFYSATGCKIKFYDFPMNDINSSNKTVKNKIREIKIDDLLFRESVSVIDESTRNFYTGKVVMVTGCGSIGSELCRQIATCAPSKLVIVDIYENNIYDIEQELGRIHGAGLDLAVEIASVRDYSRMEAIFDHYRPEIVFHAAAHKHVPLMEHSSCEAVKNNVYGTYNVADLAEKYGADKFILISTDKAVNPTNVMGATKRMCEMIVQSKVDSKTTFSAVRFGNVLGSNGSVIPLFRSQIASGGPVTITDKRIIRYFMTIPEASQLVMQTGAMAKNGELFVLDMGEPVKILDLAENLIKLSGFKPYEDIDIVEVGLRPGEKLYEELLIKSEKLTKTQNGRIFIEQDHPLTREELEGKLSVLAEALKEQDDSVDQQIIVKALKSVVPTYVDPETLNCKVETEKQ